jgi:hypothetical protein
MSLPPSALYPHSGVAYNQLNSCYYSVNGLVSNGFDVVGKAVPFDAGTGTAPTGLFIQMGRDVGLKPNRTVPTVGTQPQIGALVNTSSVPTYVSGVATVLSDGDFLACNVRVIRQRAGQAISAADILGYTQVLTDLTARAITVPFTGLVNPLDSLIITFSSAQTAGVNFNVVLIGLKATHTYGALNSIQADYIPA